jgi:hypothetical protein
MVVVDNLERILIEERSLEEELAQLTAKAEGRPLVAKETPVHLSDVSEPDSNLRRVQNMVNAIRKLEKLNALTPAYDTLLSEVVKSYISD